MQTRAGEILPALTSQSHSLFVESGDSHCLSLTSVTVKAPWGGGGGEGAGQRKARWLQFLTRCNPNLGSCSFFLAGSEEAKVKKYFPLETFDTLNVTLTKWKCLFNIILGEILWGYEVGHELA